MLCAHALSYLLFKTMQDRIFTAFLPRERIKISGCSFEFKCQPTHSYQLYAWEEKGMGSLVHGEFTWETLSRVKQGAHKIRWVAHGLVGCPFKFKHPLNLNGQLTYFYINNWCTRVAWDAFCMGENSWEVASREFKWAQRSEVAQGVEFKRWFVHNWTNLIKIG